MKMKKYLLIFFVVLSLCALSAYLSCFSIKRVRAMERSYSDSLAISYINSEVEKLTISVGSDNIGFISRGSEIVMKWLICVPKDCTSEDLPYQLDHLRDDLIRRMWTCACCSPDLDVSWESRRQPPDWVKDELMNRQSEYACYYEVIVRYRGIIYRQ